MTTNQSQQNPSTADSTVVAVFDSSAAAERAIEALRQSGYSNKELALVTSQSEAGQTIASVASGDNATKDSAIGAGIGGLGGAALAFLGAGTALAIPGIGPVLLGLGGLLVGGAAGGWIGSLLGIEVPEHVASRYNELAQKGGLILFVRPFQGQNDAVESLLRRSGAKGVERYPYTFSISSAKQTPGATTATQSEPILEPHEPPEHPA